MHVPPEIKDLSDTEYERLKVELRILIAAVAERVHYAEGRRSQFLTVGAALVAGGVALFTAISQTTIYPYWWCSLLVMSFGLFLLGFLLWYVFSVQVNRYPWTSATKTWKWFYRDALPRDSALSVGAIEYIFNWSTTSDRVEREFEAQLDEFRHNMVVGLMDRASDLDQDLQQLYVLHVNEKYKNIFLTHLRKTLNYGVIIVILVSCAVTPLIEWIIRQDIISCLSA